MLKTLAEFVLAAAFAGAVNLLCALRPARAPSPEPKPVPAEVAARVNCRGVFAC